MEEFHKLYQFKKKTHSRAFMKWISSHHSIKIKSLFRDGKALYAYKSDANYYRYIELAQAFSSGIKCALDEMCQKIMGECVNDIVKSSDKKIERILTNELPLDEPDTMIN